MENRIKVDILPNVFLKSDKTYDKDESILLCGKIAGECYDKEGFNHILGEEKEKTLRRVNMTLNNGHHSVYDHAAISLNLQNVPKILAMVLNNEREYTTSEKSARYTPVERKESPYISIKEEELYNKWIEIFKVKIKSIYGNFYDDSKIQKLSQENARYLVTVFMPTQMIYTTSLRQINYIVSWMQKYMNECDKTNTFNQRLVSSMQEFINELERLYLLEPGLLKNEKERSLSLFGTNLKDKKEVFGDVYLTKYKGSFAQLAQAHRHRTLCYQIEALEKEEFFIPPIIEKDKILASEWLKDIKCVSSIYPQGMLTYISECGTYENFILKCKERLCSSAQLEIMLQTRETLLKYKEALEKDNHPLQKDIIKYTHGARCTFPDFTCQSDCKFKEGKLLTRKI